jgi:phage N-6-adenine-methyltransferase
MSDNFLIHIDTAKREILAADSLVKVKDLWNKSEAMRQLGQAAKDPELINYATEFKLRCERRLGEMLAVMKDAGEFSRGQPEKNPVTPRIILSEMNIDAHLSSRAQRIAAVPEEKFEAVMAKARQEEQQITRRTVEELLSPSKPQRWWSVWTGDNHWYTPEIYVDSARRVLGGIDLDPASDDEAQKTVGAKEFFTEETDGLKQEWKGRIFLNPPYSYPLIGDFIAKLCDEFFAGNVEAAILLTDNCTDTKWWHEAARASQAICFTQGRINYYKADGRISQPTRGQCFFYLGVHLPRFAAEFSKHGLTIGVYPWQRNEPMTGRQNGEYPSLGRVEIIDPRAS